MATRSNEENFLQMFPSNSLFDEDLEHCFGFILNLFYITTMSSWFFKP